MKKYRLFIAQPKDRGTRKYYLTEVFDSHGGYLKLDNGETRSPLGMDNLSGFRVSVQKEKGILFRREDVFRGNDLNEEGTIGWDLEDFYGLIAKAEEVEINEDV